MQNKVSFLTYSYTCVIQVQLFGFKDKPNYILWMVLTVVSTEISLWEHPSTLFSCTFKSSFWIGLMWPSEAGTRGVLYEKLILRRATLIKRRPWHGCFLVNFEKFLRNPFYKIPPGHCFWILWKIYSHKIFQKQCLVGSSEYSLLKFYQVEKNVPFWNMLLFPYVCF